MLRTDRLTPPFDWVSQALGDNLSELLEDLH